MMTPKELTLRSRQARACRATCRIRQRMPPSQEVEQAWRSALKLFFIWPSGLVACTIMPQSTVVIILGPDSKSVQVGS